MAVDALFKVVLLLLLCQITCTQKEKKNCDLTEHKNYTITSSFHERINELKRYTIKDYYINMYMVSEDNYCSALWNVHATDIALKALQAKAQDRLARLIGDVRVEINFTNNECSFEVSNTCRTEKQLIGDVLDKLNETLKKLQETFITSEDANYSNCSVIQCTSGASTNAPNKETTAEEQENAVSGSVSGASTNAPNNETTAEEQENAVSGSVSGASTNAPNKETTAEEQENAVSGSVSGQESDISTVDAVEDSEKQRQRPIRLALISLPIFLLGIIFLVFRYVCRRRRQKRVEIQEEPEAMPLQDSTASDQDGNPPDLSSPT